MLEGWSDGFMRTQPAIASSVTPLLRHYRSEERRVGKECRCGVWIKHCKKDRGTQQGAGIFFVSSRRRHTRSLCDWSSDVCSSDLNKKNRRVEVKVFPLEKE